MSVRAHRVVRIVTAGESFNLWHDENLMDWLKENTSFYHQLNEDGCGLTEIPVNIIEEAIEKIDFINKDTKKALKEDIELMKEKDEEYIKYYCY